MASRVEVVFEKMATLPQAKTTPQINPAPPKSNPVHCGRLRKRTIYRKSLCEVMANLRVGNTFTRITILIPLTTDRMQNDRFTAGPQKGI